MDLQLPAATRTDHTNLVDAGCSRSEGNAKLELKISVQQKLGGFCFRCESILEGAVFPVNSSELACSRFLVDIHHQPRTITVTENMHNNI